MESLNMKYEELVNFYDSYKFDTVSTLEVLLRYVKKYDTILDKSVCSEISQKKYSILCEEGYFEGSNEYPDDLDLSEIRKSINYLYDNELVYLKKILEEFIVNAPKGLKEYMQDDINSIINKIDNKLRGIVEDEELSKEELRQFFNKYNIIELQEMNTIFKYVNDYDIKDALAIRHEVCINKFEDCKKLFELPVKPKGFTLLSLTKKNNLLTDKELNYLYQLVSNASFYLSTIREYTYEFVDIDEKEYPIDIVNKLESILYEENEKRKYSRNKVLKKH